MEQKDLIILALTICVLYLTPFICLGTLLLTSQNKKQVTENKDNSKLPSQITHQELTDMFNKIEAEHGWDAAYTFLENFGKQSSREVEIRLRNLGAR